MTEINYAERVARGAALLDEKWPEWRDEVDLGRLDIEKPYNCMTAQYAQHVIGSRHVNFSAGRQLLELGRDAYAEYGFNAFSEFDDEDFGDGAYAEGIAILNDLWRDLIVQHRYAPEPRPESETSA